MMKAGWWSNTEPDTSAQSPVCQLWVGSSRDSSMVQTGQLCTGKISVLYLRVKLGEDIEPLAGTVGVTQMFSECILSWRGWGQGLIKWFRFWESHLTLLDFTERISTQGKQTANQHSLTQPTACLENIELV